MTWHEDPHNPIFSPAEKGWDSYSIRLDCVVHVPEEDAYYIYYSGTDVADAHNRIGLAICPVGPDGYSSLVPETIRREGESPVLPPEPAEPYCETMVSQAAVLRERDAAGRWRWFMYYSYRGRNGVLPGIRLAVSSDGKTWQRKYNADDPRGMGHLFFPTTPNTYYEWHQIFRVDRTYVLSMEVGPNRGERWRPCLAVSREPDRGWEPLDQDTVLQTKWGEFYTEAIYHVATPAFYEIGGRWYLFAQACPKPATGNYLDGRWDLWAFPCERRISTLPGLPDLWISGDA